MRNASELRALAETCAGDGFSAEIEADLTPTSKLFVNATRDAMTRAGFEYILAKHTRAAAAACASLSRRSVSPHQLRHSCAITMLQAALDIRMVALWLGHADIRTTEIYLRIHRRNWRR